MELKNPDSRAIQPQDVFEAGYGHLYFARRALKLSFKGEGRLPNTISPLATYSSLSLELFLKARIFQTKHQPLEKGHDLMNLWNKLDEIDRKELTGLVGLSKSDFEKILIDHKDMFRTARYNYELANVRYNKCFLANLAEIVGHYFVQHMKGKWEPPAGAEFYFYTVSPNGKLNRHPIKGNTALYETFPSHHTHHIQEQVRLELIYIGGGQFKISRGG